MAGKVVNERNEPIQGATVVVDGSALKAIADIEGRFILNLETGIKYSIMVSSVGYDTKQISDIEVGANLDNTITVVLQVKATTGETVVVRSTRRQESTAALLAFQRSNTALSSGLAADFIRRTPDKNTGEVLKRVSGASIQDNRFVVVRGLSDRYNTAVINNAQLPSTEPDKKAFSFDVFPATLIDNIIINKTATPDLTGEFAGGLVQVNTKDVPTKDVLSVGFSFGFNTQSVFNDFLSNKRNSKDWLGYDDGTRSLPDGFLLHHKPIVYSAATVPACSSNWNCHVSSKAMCMLRKLILLCLPKPTISPGARVQNSRTGLHWVQLYHSFTGTA
ncbi:MAG: TonB-dependent receptor plug domain-containing protein [Bacteroidia bacterium]|nr:TonB-dependent receptor plug domain-containing protein [Bacteroidia bacterium]